MQNPPEDVLENGQPDSINATLSALLQSEAWSALIDVLTRPETYDEPYDPSLVLRCWRQIESAGFAVMEDTYLEFWARFDANGDNSRRDSLLDRYALAHHLAILLRSGGCLGEGVLKLHRRALWLGRRAVGPRHPFFGRTLNAVGILHGARGEASDAERAFRRALDIFETQAEEDLNLEDIEITVSNLANLLSEYHRFDEASELRQRALDLQAQWVEPGDLRYIQSLNTYACDLKDAEEIDEALAVSRRALELALADLGPDHPETCRAMSNTGALLALTGASDEAEAMVRDALQCAERIHGSGHPETTTELMNLGDILVERGQFDEAVIYFRRARAILLQANAPWHLDVATIEQSLGGVAWARGDAHKALEHWLKGLDIVIRAVGRDHEAVRDWCLRIAQGYTAIGEHTLATAYLIRGGALDEDGRLTDGGSE
jgi:tetratricopeptide (TPR) repeat protein